MIEIKNTPITDLVPYVNNARTHSEAQIKKIAASIKEFGFNNPILIDGDYGVIAGHGRLSAARLLGLKVVPTLCIGHLDDTRRRAYILADNRTALDAGWDTAVLKSELESLKSADFDLALTGFTDKEIDSLLNSYVDEGSEDFIEPQEAEKTVTRRGDIWVLDNHKILCGDSLDAEQVTLLIGEGEAIDAAFIDPPYGVSVVPKNGKIGRGKKGTYRAVQGDDSTEAAIAAYNLCAALKIPNLIFWGANYYSFALPKSPCWVVWDKQDGQHFTFADCELAWTNFKGPARLFKHVWSGFFRDSEKGEKRFHPTQKPVALAAEIFEHFSVGENVLDLFGGSGSTLIACEKTNRICRVIEIDEKYCDLMIQRWQNTTGLNAKLLSTGELYNEVKQKRGGV